jgi:hypothetical protein
VGEGKEIEHLALPLSLPSKEGKRINDDWQDNIA